jgi:hypothetical protein
VKGYRTIAFNLFALVAGLLGLHLTVDNVNMWLDLGAALIPAGNIILRMFTTTAFGRKVAQDVASVGLHPDTIRDLAGTIATAVANALPPPPVVTSGAAVVEKPVIDLSAVAEAMANALGAMQQAHAAVAAAVTVSSTAVPTVGVTANA